MVLATRILGNLIRSRSKLNYSLSQQLVAGLSTSTILRGINMNLIITGEQAVKFKLILN